jgi:hypothetical protein
MISHRTSFAGFCSGIIFIEPFKVIITISRNSCKYPQQSKRQSSTKERRLKNPKIS